jgi:hypothetical protein
MQDLLCVSSAADKPRRSVTYRMFELQAYHTGNSPSRPPIADLPPFISHLIFGLSGLKIPSQHGSPYSALLGRKDSCLRCVLKGRLRLMLSFQNIR